LWQRYSTVLKKYETAQTYIKCIMMFFGCDRRHSVTMMLLDLRLPTCLRFCIMQHSSVVRECLTSMLIL